MNLYLIIVNFTFDRFYFVYIEWWRLLCMHSFFIWFFLISELKKKMWMVVCSPMSQFVKKFNIDCCINQKAFTIECSYLIAVKSSCLIDIYIMWKLIKNKELMKYFFRNVLINEQWRCVNVCFVADFFEVFS